MAKRFGFSLLWDFSKEIDYPWREIVTRRAITQKDRDMVPELHKSSRRRDLGKKVIKKMLRLEDEELVNESYDLFARARVPIPYPNVKGMRTTFEYVALNRPEVWNHKAEEFADPTFVAELEKNRFIKELYEK